MATTLDHKQLHETGRQLTKALEGGDPPSTLVALLTPLEKWKATEELLRSSKIGIVVSKVRNSKDSKVTSLATQLINKWRADVKHKKPSHLTPNKGPNGEVRSGTNSPAPKKEAIVAAPKKFTAAPDKRNAKEDGVNTAVTGDQTRDGCILLIYNGLAFMSEEVPSEILGVSTKIEAAAFSEYKKETSAAYKAKMRSLHLNLKMKQNVALRRDVFSEAIAAQRFVTMTSEELKSEEMRKLDKELNDENMRAAQAPVEEKAISTTMQCGKCRQYRVSYTQAQTRAADEPMTTFCECTNCGNRWKFS